MQQPAFEYDTICIAYTNAWWQQMNEKLEELGLMGWELVTLIKKDVSGENRGYQMEITYISKRKLSEEEAIVRKIRRGMA